MDLFSWGWKKVKHSPNLNTSTYYLIDVLSVFSYLSYVSSWPSLAWSTWTLRVLGSWVPDFPIWQMLCLCYGLRRQHALWEASCIFMTIWLKHNFQLLPDEFWLIFSPLTYPSSMSWSGQEAGEFGNVMMNGVTVGLLSPHRNQLRVPITRILLICSMSLCLWGILHVVDALKSSPWGLTILQLERRSEFRK